MENRGPTRAAVIAFGISSAWSPPSWCGELGAGVHAGPPPCRCWRLRPARLARCNALKAATSHAAHGQPSHHALTPFPRNAVSITQAGLPLRWHQADLGAVQHGGPLRQDRPDCQRDCVRVDMGCHPAAKVRTAVKRCWEDTACKQAAGSKLVHDVSASLIYWPGCGACHSRTDQLPLLRWWCSSNVAWQYGVSG